MYGRLCKIYCSIPQCHFAENKDSHVLPSLHLPVPDSVLNSLPCICKESFDDTSLVSSTGNPSVISFYLLSCHLPYPVCGQVLVLKNSFCLFPLLPDILLAELFFPFNPVLCSLLEYKWKFSPDHSELFFCDFRYFL